MNCYYDAFTSLFFGNTEWSLGLWLVNYLYLRVRNVKAHFSQICSTLGRIACPLVVAVRSQLQSKHFFSSLSCVLFSARTAQRQCCLGSLGESQCLAGINAARGGDMCQESANDKCGIDSYKASIYDQIPQQRTNTVHRVHNQT